MTVTREQAQMLTTLAIACRPNRAPTWDAAGVMKAIEKVAGRSLAEVTLAVIRAASDRECVSPGVIPSNGSHWQEQLKPEKWQPTVLEPAERCSICSQDPIGCETRRVNQRGMDPDDPRFDDHSFQADFKQKRDGETVRQIAAALKADVAPTSPPPVPRSLDDVARNPHVTEARKALAEGVSA